VRLRQETHEFKASLGYNSKTLSQKNNKKVKSLFYTRSHILGVLETAKRKGTHTAKSKVKLYSQLTPLCI
jgi:hypothetical protein